MTNPIRPMLTTAQVAKRLGVKSSKVLAWIKSGEIKAVNIAANPSGRPRFRITVENLQAFETRRAATTAPRQPKRYKKRTGLIEYIK